MYRGIYFSVDHFEYPVSQNYDFNSPAVITADDLFRVVAYIQVDVDQYLQVANPLIEFYQDVYRLTYPGVCMGQDTTVHPVIFTTEDRHVVATDLGEYFIRKGITFIPVFRITF